MAGDDFVSGLPTSTANKRRSLLLPKGTLSAAVQRGALEKNGSKPRPMSMFGMESLSSRDLLALAGETPGSRPRAETTTRLQGLGRAIEEEPIKRMDPMDRGQNRPAASGIARSQSLRKPTAGLSSRSDGRTDSISIKPMPRLPESTAVYQTSRVPSPGSPVDVDPSRARSKLPGPQTTSLRRSNTSTNRHSRAISSLPTFTPAPTTNAGSRTSQLKPSFSTLQQHYSPRKTTAPKPASSALIHAASVDTSSTLSLDTQLLQTSLLQLSLLHSSFIPTYVSWSHSARRKMRATFTEVASRAELVQNEETKLRQRKNVAVLLEWGGGPDQGLAENIQTLAELVQEASVMSEDAGRVGRCVGQFEQWIEQVQQIWGQRDTRLAVVSDLGEAWRSESTTLIRRLRSLVRILEGLERPTESDSTLAEVLAAVDALFRGMLEELTTVVEIEKTVMVKEKEWIDLQLQELSLSSDDAGLMGIKT